MKIFCQKCGSGSEYSAEKPKFCSACGNSFSLLIKAADASPKVLSQIKKPRARFDDNKVEPEVSRESVNFEDDDDYDTNYEFPEGFSLANITKLDVDIEKPSITSTRIDVDPASNKIRVKESRDL